MNKVKIFGIGTTGLLGTRISEVLRECDFRHLSLDNGVNIIEKKSLEVLGEDNERKIVLHLAAKTNVDECERDRNLAEKGEAYIANAIGTKNVTDACVNFGKKLIYFSTDMVFDGKKPEPEGYSENDSPSPVNWYAYTKLLGERVIEQAGIPYAIARIAYPYRSDSFSLKKDFVHAIIAKLKENQVVEAIEDHIMSPTFVDDIALAVEAIIKNRAEGIFHVAGGQAISPYEAALKIAKTFGFDRSLVVKTTRDKFFQNRAPRPFNLKLNNDKILSIGVRMRNFDEGLKLIL